MFLKRTYIFLLLFCTLLVRSQNYAKLLEGDSVVWFGLDFSKAKFIGSFSHIFGIDPNGGGDLVSQWIPDWNNLFIKEPMNFDMRTALKKPNLYYDLASVKAINSKIISDSVFTELPIKYKIANPESAIAEMIKAYDSEKVKSGLGSVFIVESFNKETLNANIYFVLFEIAEKKVIGYRRLTGIPKGIGIRNYWAGAIKDIIGQVKNSAYPMIKSNQKAKK